MATNGATHGASAHSHFSSTSTIPLWLNGEEKTLSSTFEVTSPVTNKTLYKSSAATKDDAQSAISAAEAALESWSHTKPSVRRDIFLKAAEIWASRKDEAFTYWREETGAERPMFDFVYQLGLDGFKDVAGLCQTVVGSVPAAAEEGTSAIVYKEPYGVILGIAPWNAPYALGVRACLMPLAAGNTVVLKGPELNPASYWFIGSVLHDAGLPKGCLNTIYHRPGADAASVTEALISHPAVKKVNFTGSTAVGSMVASMSGKYLKPVLMELGGKAPAIVCEDADVDKAAFQCALGAFLHSGQICMSTERILVHKDAVSNFRTALKAAVDQVFGGADSPILVTHLPVEKNKKLLADAKAKGAKTLYGDFDAHEESKTRMRPVIIEGVKEEMDIYHTESFGPTVALYVVESDEEAIRIANDTEYGLSSAVFTEDLRRGLKIARRIESGAVHINRMTVHDEPALPHGGVKKSGWGRFNGREGMEEWLRTKTVTWKD